MRDNNPPLSTGQRVIFRPGHPWSASFGTVVGLYANSPVRDDLYVVRPDSAPDKLVIALRDELGRT